MDLAKPTEFQPVDLIGLLRAEMKKCARASGDTEAITCKFFEPAEGDVWVNGDSRLIRQLVSQALEALRHRAKSKIQMRVMGTGAEGTSLILEDDGPPVPVQVGGDTAAWHAIAEAHGWGVEIEAAKVTFRLRRIYTEPRGRRAL